MYKPQYLPVFIGLTIGSIIYYFIVGWDAHAVFDHTYWEGFALFVLWLSGKTRSI